MMRDTTFTSHGITCAGWHVVAESGALAGPQGRPCVVMANGFGGTRDTGLLLYAEAFAAAGIDALVFDYRGFGDSEGEPRQDISYRRQRQDYHAAIDAARRLPGVDLTRIALWGTSYSGGHALAVAVQDGHVAATVSMTPAMDGLTTMRMTARTAGLGHSALLGLHAFLDIAQTVAGRGPHHVAIVGPPGSAAVMTAPGSEQAYIALAGPTWRNQARARVVLEIGRNRPTTFARRLTRPILIQVGTNDSVVPAAAARRAAEKAGKWAELREYPVDHFDVYTGPWQRRAAADQIAFLTRVFRN